MLNPGKKLDNTQFSNWDAYRYLKLPCVIGAVLFCLVLASCSCISPVVPTTHQPSVADLVKEIQLASDEFYVAPDAKTDFPPLKSVKLTLQTVTESKTSGEVDYLVVALKGFEDNSSTEQFDLTLSPEPPKENKALFGADSIYKTLYAAISNASNEIRRSYPGIHPLYTSEVDVQVSFAVTWDGSAGVNKWVLTPISVNASEELSRKYVQTIAFVFAYPPSK